MNSNSICFEIISKNKNEKKIPFVNCKTRKYMTHDDYPHTYAYLNIYQVNMSGILFDFYLNKSFFPPRYSLRFIGRVLTSHVKSKTAPQMILLPPEFIVHFSNTQFLFSQHFISLKVNLSSK